MPIFVSVLSFCITNHFQIAGLKATTVCWFNLVRALSGSSRADLVWDHSCMVLSSEASLGWIFQVGLNSVSGSWCWLLAAAF